MPILNHKMWTVAVYRNFTTHLKVLRAGWTKTIGQHLGCEANEKPQNICVREYSKYFSVKNISNALFSDRMRDIEPSDPQMMICCSTGVQMQSDEHLNDAIIMMVMMRKYQKKTRQIQNKKRENMSSSNNQNERKWLSGTGC